MPQPPDLRGVAIDGANVIATAVRRGRERLDAAVAWFAAWRPDLPVTVFLDAATFARLDPAAQSDLAARTAGAAGAAGAADVRTAAATFVVCAKGEEADVPLLRHAAENGALVVSNDRFFDHDALRANAITVQFTFAAGRFTPADEATWFRTPGLALRVPLAALQAK